MLRVLMKPYSGWRFLCTTINRMNDNVPKLDILTHSKQGSQLSEILDDRIISKPPVYAEPFSELQPEETKNMPSEIGDFVDSLGPPLPITFNLAAYVNHSETLQNLVHLGVDLSEIDRKPDMAKFLANLDFEQHCKHHIQFLHDNGVSADDMGKLFTKNPFIFKENLEDLEVRINYLKSKKFGSNAIARIITNNPYFLSLNTKQVDHRLGFFQKQFSLQGSEVRYLIAKRPKLITYKMEKFLEKLFLMKEEFGFTSQEMKTLLLTKPKIWMLGRPQLKERFDVVHNLMGISQETITKFPDIFAMRAFITKQRHLYLAHLHRAQYDPTQPLYISLRDLICLSDSEFCEQCAKTSVELYNEFLKTL